MKISIVTVSYNSSHIISNFIENLDVRDVKDFELIIVDSGSVDAKLTEEIGQKAGARVIRSELNVGYGTGSNIGAAAAQGSWLVFVNPDVLVTRQQIRDLVITAEKYELSCVGPQVSDMAGNLKRSWGRTIAPPWRRRSNGFTEDGPLILAETISGCCMAISSLEFKRLDGFDESFFMFCEEMDLHRRLGNSNGRVAVACDIVVRTPGGASSSGVTDRWRLVERMVGHTQYIFKHFSRAEGYAAVTYNLAKIVLLPKYRSRRASLSQFALGLRRSIEST